MATGTPIVEVSLGSSEPKKTGAFVDGSIIISSRETCVPCAGLESCFRQNHACASSISPDFLASISHYRLLEDWESVYRVAELVRAVNVVYLTWRGGMPVWHCSEINSIFSEKNVSLWIRQVSCFLFLQCRDKGGVFENEIGSL